MSKEGAGVRWLRKYAGYEGDGCLIWPFCLVNGYGSFGYQSKVLYAHRFMCEMVNGPAPTPSHEVSHSCGRGHEGCVHPQHLSWKTRSENQLDRANHGTKNSWAARGKIGPEDAEKIRALRGQMKQREIAELFGISRAQISSIQTGRFRNKTVRGYYHSGNKFYARVFIRGREIVVGSFHTAEEAHAAYLVANAKVRAGMPLTGG